MRALARRRVMLVMVTEAQQVRKFRGQPYSALRSGISMRYGAAGSAKWLGISRPTPGDLLSPPA